MPRRALIVGINSYDHARNLHSCVADAEAMAKVLARHKDGEKNFDCIELLDQMRNGSPVTRAGLRRAIMDLFAYDGDVLLYFSGHGFLSETGGVLCTPDGTPDDWGLPMEEVFGLALRSPARQVLLLLDCCHGGNIATPPAFNSTAGVNPLAMLRENMTVIAASRERESAIEAGGHGLFTQALLDALDGGAADHLGLVTAPAIYMYVSRRFAAWDQRPVYKTSATDILCVRRCEPWIDRKQLDRLTTLFETPEYKYRLDPEYEPEDEHGNRKEPVIEWKVEIARLFKEYRDAGLLRPSDPTQQLFWVARHSGTVELTARGREYWWLLKYDKI
jgi:hypothetical protein